MLYTDVKVYTWVYLGIGALHHLLKKPQFKKMNTVYYPKNSYQFWVYRTPLVELDQKMYH